MERTEDFMGLMVWWLGVSWQVSSHQATKESFLQEQKELRLELIRGEGTMGFPIDNLGGKSHECQLVPKDFGNCQTTFPHSISLCISATFKTTCLDIESYVPLCDVMPPWCHGLGLGQRDLSNELKPQLLELTSALMRSQEISGCPGGQRCPGYIVDFLFHTPKKP